jgi:hypothetical protein
MSQPEDPNSLYVPLFEALDAIGFGEYENPRHFNTGTLFWSITRLFGCYERIISVIHLERDQRQFLDADLENFIIRFRIVLNDLAYVIWQIFPINTRGLKSPKGQTHPKNREMSVFQLADFLKKNATNYPELAAAFTDANHWMRRLKNDRDNVIHYKSKVLIFEGPLPRFALLNAAGTERTESTPEGGQRLALQPVEEFVNGQMVALHRFMHEHLAMAVNAYAARESLKLVQAGWGQRISCPGISSFRQANSFLA